MTALLLGRSHLQGTHSWEEGVFFLSLFFKYYNHVADKEGKEEQQVEHLGKSVAVLSGIRV